MRTLKNKRWMIIFLVLFVMVGLWKGCGVVANKELLASVSLHEVNQESFEQVYQTRGVVEGKTVVRYPIAGVFTQAFVKVGDVVKNKERLVSYQIGDVTKELVSKMDGIVSEVNEGYVEIVEQGALWLKIQVPSRHIDKIAIGDKVQVQEFEGKIVEIANVPSYKQSENYYDVYVSIEKGSLSLGEEVDVIVKVETFNSVYKVPFDAVVSGDLEEYVIKKSWLEHPMELLDSDKMVVNVIGVEQDFLVIQSDEAINEEICVFSGLSLSFIQEMLALNV